MTFLRLLISFLLMILLTVSDPSINELLLKINLELPSIYNWLFCANKLALHLKETKYIVFQPQLKIYYNLLPPLILAG